jgi:nitrite reductase/ring-hydroxylating ferredoxin subunit
MDGAAAASASKKPAAEVSMGRPAGRERWMVEHEGRRYAVFEHREGFVVTDASCPHRGGPLIDATLRDGCLVCPWHWYAFDLETGSCRTAASTALTLYPARLRDGEVIARIPPPAPLTWSALLRAHARGEPTDGVVR